MNILSKVLILMTTIAMGLSPSMVLRAKAKYDLDEKIIAGRLDKIKVAFDLALASNDIKKITKKLIIDINNCYQQFFTELKQQISRKDRVSVKQYFTIIKDTVQKLQTAFDNQKQPLDIEKLLGIIFLCAFKMNSLTEAEPSLEIYIDSILSSRSMLKPLCTLAQDAIQLLIILADNAKKQLNANDIKLFKLSENIVAMTTIAKLFDGDFKMNWLKAQFFGPKVSEKTVAKIVLFWTSLAPVYLELEKQIIEQNIRTILQNIVTLTDGFIAQLS